LLHNSGFACCTKWRRNFNKPPATLSDARRCRHQTASPTSPAGSKTCHPTAVRPAGANLRIFIRLNELEAALARITRRVAALEGLGAAEDGARGNEAAKTL
jgi:hypothetical protein